MVERLRSQCAQDLLYALRSLRKSPGYAAVTILTLALGIGANTAIFSVVNGVILKPLPYPPPERLIFITSQFPGLGFDQFWVSAPEFVEFAESNRSFQQVGAYRAGAVNLGTPDQPRRVNSAVVTSELMPVLGVAPIRGRQFTREDTLPGAEDVAVLSSELWRSAFGGDESVVGRTVPIDGAPTRIVGIMPPGYDVHDSARPGVAAADARSRESRWPRRLISSTSSGGLRTASASQQAQGRSRVDAARSGRSAAQGESRAEPRSASAAVRRVAGRSGRQPADRALGAAGRGRVRAAHCVRQPGEPDARPRGVAPAGVRDPLGARRRPLAAAAAVPDRRHGARAHRRRARRRARVWRACGRCLPQIPESLPRAGEITLDPIVLLFTVLVSLGHRSSSSAWRRCCICASRS